MSLYEGEMLVVTDDFTILSFHPDDEAPRRHFHQDYKKGEKVYYTGKTGACLLLDGSVVPGIEVSKGRKNFVPFDKVHFNLPADK